MAVPAVSSQTPQNASGQIRESLIKQYGFCLALASVGGFLESYTYVTRGGVFANAQTGNIARMGIKLAEGDLFMAFRYLIPVLAFVFGVTLSIQVRRKFPYRVWTQMNPDQLLLLMEIFLLTLVGFIAPGQHDILATVLVSFVCALQVESFRTFGTNAFASTMCTGNLRIATENLNRYFTEKDPALLKKSLQYYGIDVVFLTGVYIGYCFTHRLSTRAVWTAALVLAFLFGLLCAERRRMAARQN